MPGNHNVLNSLATICIASDEGVSDEAIVEGLSQIAQAWVANHPGVDVMLVGADTTAQFDSALAALDTQLDAEELHELERNYTPCDVINDYTAGRRILREARPGLDRFNLIEAVA